jgi:hypothetical protein
MSLPIDLDGECTATTAELEEAWVLFSSRRRVSKSDPSLSGSPGSPSAFLGPRWKYESKLDLD